MWMYVIPSEKESLRGQVFQTFQAIHLLWPPWLIMGLRRRGRRMAKAYIEKIKFPMPVKGRWKVVVTMWQWFDVPKSTKQGKGTGGPGNTVNEDPPEEWVPTGTPEEIQQQLDEMDEAIADLYPDPVGEGAAEMIGGG